MNVLFGEHKREEKKSKKTKKKGGGEGCFKEGNWCEVEKPDVFIRKKRRLLFSQ